MNIPGFLWNILSSFQVLFIGLQTFQWSKIGSFLWIFMGNTQCARLLVSNSMKWGFLLFWLIWLNFDTARFLIFYLFISIILYLKMWKENDGTALHLLWKYSFVNKQCLFDYILPNVSVILQQMVHSFFFTTFIWCFFTTKGVLYGITDTCSYDREFKFLAHSTTISSQNAYNIWILACVKELYVPKTQKNKYLTLNISKRKLPFLSHRINWQAIFLCVFTEYQYSVPVFHWNTYWLGST